MNTTDERLNKVVVLSQIIIDDLTTPLTSRHDAELHELLSKLQLLCYKIKEEKNGS
jgi:hypothetical protein